MTIRRPPTRIGAIEPAPAMPCAKPGTTPVKGNDAAAPRAQDESNVVPFDLRTPTYWTFTVDVGVATEPVPVTRSRHSSCAVTPLPLLLVTVGAARRLVAPETATPSRLDAAGPAHALGAPGEGAVGDDPSDPAALVPPLRCEPARLPAPLTVDEQPDRAAITTAPQSSRDLCIRPP